MTAYPANIAIKVQNFKSFGEELSGFENIFPINIIIGRNNSGKSSLLDIIKFLISPSGFESEYWHDGNEPKFIATKTLTKTDVSNAFPSTVRGGVIGINHFEYGKQWIGKPVKFIIDPNKREFIEIEPKFDDKNIEREFSNKLVANLTNPLTGKIFRKLAADRDIKPEVDTGPGDIDEKGTGTTNMIQQFLSRSDMDPSFVEERLLKALNEIFNPDSFFERILIKHRPTGTWEIYLKEKDKALIPLTQSGSGLKTVILVLVHIILLPKFKGRSLSDYVFAFEELENNLHPGLQRRLLNYLRKIALENDCCFFLTTHSNVVIDLFSKDEKAQIVHVIHNGKFAQSRKIQTHIDNHGVLDDLDIRASDLLQSNAIIWVEGPSDRYYMNRWIELFTNGALKEGSHYQCMFYGGRLLSHLSIPIEEAKAEHEINILRINGHAILLMDSDMRSPDEKIGETKKRLQKEIEAVGGYSWISYGKEIENYLPLDALRAMYPTKKIKKGPGRFGNFSDYLESIEKFAGKRFEKNKVIFADKIGPLLKKDMLKKVGDWSSKMTDVCDKIALWNKIAELPK